MGKAEGAFFGIIAVYCAIADVVYWFVSHDPVGVTCLALTSALGSLVAFYLTLTARRLGPRPEDRPNAEIADGAGDIGHFSPASPWPIAMAFSAMLVLLGIIIGLWLTFIAVAALLFSVGGLLFEQYRGNDAYTAEIVGIDPIAMIGGHSR